MRPAADATRESAVPPLTRPANQPPRRGRDPRISRLGRLFMGGLVTRGLTRGARGGRRGAERAARQPARLKKALMEEAENHVRSEPLVLRTNPLSHAAAPGRADAAPAARRATVSRVHPACPCRLRCEQRDSVAAAVVECR